MKKNVKRNSVALALAVAMSIGAVPTTAFAGNDVDSSDTAEVGTGNGGDIGSEGDTSDENSTDNGDDIGNEGGSGDENGTSSEGGTGDENGTGNEGGSDDENGTGSEGGSSDESGSGDEGASGDEDAPSSTEPSEEENNAVNEEEANAGKAQMKMSPKARAASFSLNIENEAAENDDWNNANVASPLPSAGATWELVDNNNTEAGTNTIPVKAYVRTKEGGWTLGVNMVISGVQAPEGEEIREKTVYPLSTPIVRVDDEGKTIYYTALKHEDGFWHLDGCYAEDADSVNVTVKDTSGDIHRATGEESGNGWHGIYVNSDGSKVELKLDTKLPDPNMYANDKRAGTYTNVYIPTIEQMNEINEQIGKVAGLQSVNENGDGVISWQFVRKDGADGQKQWELQGTYSPNYAHIYVYVVGDDTEMNGTDNGRGTNDYDQDHSGEVEIGNKKWYTYGDIKIDMKELEDIWGSYEELQAMLSQNVKNYLDLDKDRAAEMESLNGRLKQVVLNALENGGLTEYQSEELWNTQLYNVDWFGLKVEKGADNYVSDKYLTLHLNGYLVPVPVDPDPTDPTPTNPTPTTPGGSTGTSGTTSGNVVVADGPVPMAETPVLEVPEEAVPLGLLPNEEVEVENEAIPLGDAEMVDIAEESVPLSDVPKTGDAPVIEFGGLLLIGCGALALKLRREEEK